MLNLKWLWVLLILMAVYTPAQANHITTKPKTTQYNLNDHIKTKYPSLLEASSFSYEYDIKDHIILKSLPRSSIRFNYEGIQSLIIKQIDNRINSLGRRSLRTRYQETYMTESEFQQEYNRMKFAELVHQGCAWWLDRTWMDYLPPEKGGVPFSPEVRTIGSTHKIYEIGPININNIGKISVDKFGFFDIQTDENFSRLEPLETPTNDGYDETPTNKKPPKRIIDIYIRPNQPEPKRENWYKNRYWKLSIRPGARVRFSLDNFQYTGDVSIKFGAEFYYGKLHFADLEFIIKYKPVDNELKANFSFAIITF